MQTNQNSQNVHLTVARKRFKNNAGPLFKGQWAGEEEVIMFEYLIFLEVRRLLPEGESLTFTCSRSACLISKFCGFNCGVLADTCYLLVASFLPETAFSISDSQIYQCIVELRHEVTQTMTYSFYFQEKMRVAVLLLAEILEICEHQLSVSEVAKNSQLANQLAAYGRIGLFQNIQTCGTEVI